MPIRSRALRGALVSLCFVSALPAQDVADRLAGRWLLEPAASDDIAAAVDRAVAPLNFVVRPVARRRLQAVNRPASHIDVTVGRDTIVLAWAGEPPATARRDGTAAPYRDGRGERLSLRVAVARTDADPVLLREQYDAPDGIRTNRWSLAPAGDRVGIVVEVASPRLPAPLRYRLVYRRAALTTGAAGRTGGTVTAEAR